MSLDDAILMERLKLKEPRKPPIQPAQAKGVIPYFFKDETPNLDASHRMHGRTQMDEQSIASSGFKRVQSLAAV